MKRIHTTLIAAALLAAVAPSTIALETTASNDVRASMTPFDLKLEAYKSAFEAALNAHIQDFKELVEDFKDLVSDHDNTKDDVAELKKTVATLSKDSKNSNACGKKGQTYNGKGCVTAGGDSLVITKSKTYEAQKSNNVNMGKWDLCVASGFKSAEENHGCYVKPTSGATKWTLEGNPFKGGGNIYCRATCFNFKVE